MLSSYFISLKYYDNNCLSVYIRPDYVIDRVFDLFVELNANDEQMDFQIVYASGMQGDFDKSYNCIKHRARIFVCCCRFSIV